MAGKRKRNRSGQSNEREQKRPKLSQLGCATRNEPVVKQAVLAQYYRQVFTLREYLLSKLPAGSKVRRKKILSLGSAYDGDRTFGEFLDQTLIGDLGCQDTSSEERLKQFVSFSQRADVSASTIANLSGLGVYSQSEIVDFGIWLLFSKSLASNSKVPHLLCQGFRRDITLRSIQAAENMPTAIPGIISTYPNSHVIAMKAMPWPRILALMGKEGEKFMIDMILDCGVYIALSSGHGNYFQLTGQPLGELNILPIKAIPTAIHAPTNRITSAPEEGSQPSTINFVRNRMLYARAAMNARGRVRFGLRHIHVLNRYKLPAHSDIPPLSTGGISKPHPSTTHVMMYIFPRQFGLHNVFTSKVDFRTTAQPFRDYTLREDEIAEKFPMPDTAKIPKRLRGGASILVRKLQVLHERCPYNMLLEQYCPVQATNKMPNFSFQDVERSFDESTLVKTQLSGSTSSPSVTSTSTSLASMNGSLAMRTVSLLDHATPLASISAFCRRVLSRLVPLEFWGTGEAQKHNERKFYQNVDRFICMRRFETLSLHEVSQGISVSELDWLGLQLIYGKKLSKSDSNKRWEIFHEFLYYVFDSLLIPLVHANFHVTESNVHRCRLFYFRHDVWKRLSEPALASLKRTMFEEIKLEQAQKLLESRTLGFSLVRLLPKETGVRPITNLRRRTVQRGNTTTKLRSSINSTLAPIHNVLTFEKLSNPSRLKSALFSVGDIYKKLRDFKFNLRHTCPLYVVKVDVQSAFDTIPQDALVDLISKVPSFDEYRIVRHAEIKPGENYRENAGGYIKPARRWTARAKAPYLGESFEEELESCLAAGKKNVAFIENVVNQFRATDELMHLLAEHVQRNMVRMGKKYYRQKKGIPQGSVLSTLLCSYFYADLEERHLSFLKDDNSLLLRFVDDFLLITTDCGHAKRFLQIMHEGLPEYGVRVNWEKTLTNFEVTIKGVKIARLVGSDRFPYCGNLINIKTLDICRDRERRKDIPISDSLTVEFSRLPGKTFQRKVINSFKIQSHAVFFDTAFNSTSTVLSNIYTAFLETANKMWLYARSFPVQKQPQLRLIIRTIRDLIGFAFVSMKCKTDKRENDRYVCTVTSSQVEWLALSAFRTVLGRRQSKYQAVVRWLDANMIASRIKDVAMAAQMERVVLRSKVGD